MKGDNILNKLVEAWELYIKEYSTANGTEPKAIDIVDSDDFKKLIQEAQRLIMSRQLREIRELKNT